METERALAKVNLYLRVVGRRADGYHLLDSLAVFPGAADLLSAAPAEDLTLEVCGPFATRLDGENLVLRAARALAGEAGRPLGARMVLEKRLPVASGIGGGSADAAAALRLLNRVWGLGVPMQELADIGLGLGADVPVCLLSQSARMGGIGELIGVAPSLPACGIVLVNPGVPVSTPEVFRARAPEVSAMASLPAGWGGAAEMAGDLEVLGNDLEAAALRVCPAIGEVLCWLRGRAGCLLARMSGSGATCFGLFDVAADAALAAGAVPRGWWGYGGGLG